jgi:hypothetical protein
MRKLILAAGVAAFAIAAPTAAKPGGGHGGEHAQQGGGGQAKAQRGGGQAKAQRGGGQKAQRGSGGQRAAVQRGGARQAQASQRRGGGGRQAQVERRGGDQRQAHKVERRGGGQRFANFQSERGHGQKAQRVERRGNGGQRLVQNERGHGNNKAQRVERRGKNDQRFVQNERGRSNAQRFEMRGKGNRDVRVQDRGGERLALQRGGRENQRFELKDRGGRERMTFTNVEWTDRNRDFVRQVRGERFYDPRSYDRAYNTTLFVDRGLPAAYVGGCPPGLAKKSPACVPPGLARAQFVGQVLPTVYASNYFPQSLRYVYADTPDYYYRWGDGYVYRVNRTNNLVAALLPLIGAGYGIGQPFPYMADPYYSVPSYYQSFYPSYGDDYYRYANGYVYEIDGNTGYIEDVIPLLDRGYGVGQMLPVGYSYYNVPYQYRDVYYDTPNYSYRYAPGAIYQVDRDTQLITAIASLLTGGLAVGQPLPPAYSMYNVPMAYRPMYYDTPDAWYRYSDGYIYQVDPTTQLITAIVRSIV